MAEIASGQMRIRGVLSVMIGLFVLGSGAFLLMFDLGKPLPEWFPQAMQYAPDTDLETTAERLLRPLGVASLFLIAFGIVASLLGVGMVVFHRRNGFLYALLLAMFAVFVGVGVWFNLTH